MTAECSPVSGIEVEPLLQDMSRRLRDFLAERDREAACCIGVHTGGVWLAGRLAAELGLRDPVGELDISFYRDDYESRGLHQDLRPSSLPFTVDGRHLVLVDDVIMTGRTVRAALNLLFDYGRPASVCLVNLLDVATRELPIQPDIVGRRLQLEPGQRVKLSGPEPLHLVMQDAETE